MNPTLYLYRFPGPHGPGPYTMKYWWTLGCFPTGREIPFRLQEFLLTYQQEHVPLEVEEWLCCFVKDPFNELLGASSELLNAVERCQEMESVRGYKALQPSMASLLKPTKRFEKQLGVTISPVGLRAVISNPTLKKRFLDDLFEYQELIKDGGSTPHRRLAKKNMEELLLQWKGEESSETSKEIVACNKGLVNFIEATASPPDETGADEKKLIHLFTTISEGCVSCGNYDGATSMLSDTLMFCHDADTHATTHANLAISSLLNGEFKQAEYNGKEAALLHTKTKSASNTGARGYALWATAVAYQDDIEQAESIINDAISVYENNEELKLLAERIRNLRVAQVFPLSRGDIPETLRGSRSYLPAQRSRALIKGCGKAFDNEFDWVVFKNKLYPSKMNPTTNEMGSVFRRVGDLGLFVSTSRSMERL